jgi:Fic family protein
MDDLINVVNRNWEKADAVALATYVLWRLNWIHPFINGNGRTARAACYFVLCMKAGGWLRGKTILPELIRRDRAAYIDALKIADALYAKSDPNHLAPLHDLVSRLLKEQLDGDPAPAPDPASGGAT